MSQITMEINTDDDPRTQDAMLTETDFPIFPASKVRLWVDENNRKTFQLFPRKLSITWSDDRNYWKWFTNKDESSKETVVEGVELRSVCWLEITGKFDTRYLTQGITYVVLLNMKLQFPVYGWETPVNFKLVLPNGKEKQQEKKVCLKNLPMSTWFSISFGEFVPDKSTTGEITFSMFEYEAGVWKRGLFLESVTIMPKLYYI